MSNKPELFDNEMDEKTVERISNNFPVLTDEEKDRIFSFIEKEFDEDTDTIDDDEFDDEVRGVERCIRPHWMEILGTAAMIAIVVGSIGGGSYFVNRISKNAPKENSQESTTVASPNDSDKYSVNDGKQPKVTTSSVSTVKNTVTSANVVAVPVDAEVYESALAAAPTTTVYDIESKTDITTALIEDEPIVTTMLAEPETIVTQVVTTVEPVQGEDIVTGVIDPGNVPEEMNEEKRFSAIAEPLIEKYDLITKMQVAQLPMDESSGTIVFIHGPGPFSSRAYYMEYKKVDKSVFKSMQEMKDYYSSVMKRPNINSSLFGPEISKQEYDDGYLFYSDDPDYLYLSVDGELYEHIISEKEIGIRCDQPAEITEIEDDSFKAHKLHYKAGEEKTYVVTFKFIKDFDSGKWYIDYISYNG